VWVFVARLRIAESTDEGGGGFFTQSNDPLAWFEVSTDNRVTLHVPKVDMGQGVQTPLEAQAALVDVQGDGARIWTSTQAQSRVQELVAKATGLEQETIEVIPTFLGGGFGPKLGDVAEEAARLSQGAGVPVHLGWNRPEELKDGFFAPPPTKRSVSW
jgi:CO/xanthine dehydrogenase Mo-binding subunit